MTYRRLTIFCLLTGLLACHNGKPKETGMTDEESIETLLPETVNEVTVLPLKSTEFHHELISNGKLAARQSADLRFESAEPIASIFVKNGDRVRKGQKIAELAPFRLANQTAQAKDALERAKLELQDVLIGQGYLLEDSANVPAATLRLARVKSGYDEATAAYRLAAYEEERATLTAPFDGIVANLFAKPFNTASTAEVFCTVINPWSLEAAFAVLESELPLIRIGDRVQVTPFAADAQSTEGRISEINPVVDANGMVQVRAAVAEQGKLFEGMNVKVSIHRSLGRKLVIPKGALVLRTGKQVVFTLVDGKAYWNYVRTGLENAGHYTVEEGLKEGDVVITGGNINLAHETPVKILSDTKETPQ